MFSNHSAKMRSASLHFAICLIGVVSLFATSANAQQAHQLLYNNYVWADRSLAGQQIDVGENSISAFTTTPNNQVHIYYVGADSHVHQRTQSQKLLGSFGMPVWVDEDLTQDTGAEPISFPLLAAFSEGNLQYVFYEPGTEGDVHMLFYDNSSWTDQDISAAAGHPGACAYGVMAAFTTTPNNQIHVYYQGSNYHEVRQLFFNGTSWSDEDLSAETGTDGSIAGFWAGFSIGNYQYLFYCDPDSDLHEIYYDNINWTDVDLTQQVGAPRLGGVVPIAAFVVPGTQIIEVFYIDTVDELIQISSPDNVFWSQQDLTTLTHADLADPDNTVVAFATTPNNQLHVYYISLLTSHVNQFFFNGSSWSNQDLTSITHAGNAWGQGGMAGFSVGNYQYVYYTGN